MLVGLEVDSIILEIRNWCSEALQIYIHLESEFYHHSSCDPDGMEDGCKSLSGHGDRIIYSVFIEFGTRLYYCK